MYSQLNSAQISVALSSHRAFFELQREDGYLPYNIKSRTLGTAQIQSVVSIAETAWLTWKESEDLEFLKQAYASCARWDAWLGQYRDTRGSGLCEAFCEFDTGHDNSPRFKGFPRRCPEDDARLCPDIPRAPLIAPDLSASRMGGQFALAKMARDLNRTVEADKWEKRAEMMRLQIIEWCYDAEQLCFFDLDNEGDFVRVRGDVLLRVLDEGVVSPEVFETIYARHVRNSAAFWTPFPLPSIAADDPHFVHDIPHNSWGGASQALAAMRAPRLFNRYGKRADLAHLMERWITAISAYGGFSQQMAPWTGEFDGQGRNYSPAMVVLLDFATGLHGVRREDGVLKWGCGLPRDAAESSYQANFSGQLSCPESEFGTKPLRSNPDVKRSHLGSCRWPLPNRDNPKRRATILGWSGV